MTLRPPELENLYGTDTGDRDCLSHTRLGVFLSCQEKFRWKYVERLEPAVKSAPLTMGSAFAHATELGDPQAGYNMLVEERDALAIEYGGNPWIVVPTEQDAQLQATIVLAASTAYLERFGTRARREVNYRQRIRNPETGYPSRTFDVMSRVDGIDGDTLIEDKLQSRVEKATERTLLLDRQVTLGCYLHWRCTGETIREVKYRITKKPQIRQKQTETFDAYCERIIDDYATRPEAYVFEFPLARDAGDFLRLEHELWSWCEQIRMAQREGVFPRNVASCSDYGGCDLLPLCSRQPGAISQFRVREERAAPTPIEINERNAA
jgi:hypothetical protein